MGEWVAGWGKGGVDRGESIEGGKKKKRREAIS